MNIPSTTISANGDSSAKTESTGKVSISQASVDQAIHPLSAHQVQQKNLDGRMAAANGPAPAFSGTTANTTEKTQRFSTGGNWFLAAYKAVWRRIVRTFRKKQAMEQFGLGESKFNDGNFRQAIKHFQNAIASGQLESTQQIKAHHLLCKSWIEIGNYQNAIKHLRMPNIPVQDLPIDLVQKFPTSRYDLALGLYRNVDLGQNPDGKMNKQMHGDLQAMDHWTAEKFIETKTIFPECASDTILARDFKRQNIIISIGDMKIPSQEEDSEKKAFDAIKRQSEQLFPGSQQGQEKYILDAIKSIHKCFGQAIAGPTVELSDNNFVASAHEQSCIITIDNDKTDFLVEREFAWRITSDGKYLPCIAVESIHYETPLGSSDFPHLVSDGTKIELFRSTIEGSGMDLTIKDKPAEAMLSIKLDSQELENLRQSHITHQAS